MNTDNLNEPERGVADTPHYPLLRLTAPGEPDVIDEMQ